MTLTSSNDFDEEKNLICLGKLTDAEKSLVEKLERNSDLKITEPKYFIDATSLLADVQSFSGKLDEASKSYEAIVEVSGRISALEDQRIAFQKLAELKEEIGRYDEAKLLYLKAIKLAKAFGAEFSTSAIRLAAIYKELGNYDFAEKEYLSLIESTGKDDSSHAAVVSKLARLYKEQNKFSDAENTYKDALKSIGYKYVDSKKKFELAEGLADLYSNWGRNFDAECIYRDMISKFQNQKPDWEWQSQLPAISLKIGSLIEEREDWIAAENWYSSLLPEVSNWNSGTQANLQERLAGVFERKGEIRKATTLLESALCKKSSEFGNEHPAVADLHERIGQLYLSSQNVAEAKSHFEKAIEAFSSTFGNEHPKSLALSDIVSNFLRKDAAEQ